MILLFEGINPEPWRSPRLGTKRTSGKVVPVAFKDENLRSYQEAIKETATEFLKKLDIKLPVHPSGTELTMRMLFWRQTERYHGEKRVNTRNRADVTNMQKALEDALQGVLYATDRHNVVVQSTLVDIGEEVQPRILVDCEPTTPYPGTYALDFIREECPTDGSGFWVVP